MHTQGAISLALEYSSFGTLFIALLFFRFFSTKWEEFIVDNLCCCFRECLRTRAFILELHPESVREQGLFRVGWLGSGLSQEIQWAQWVSLISVSSASSSPSPDSGLLRFVWVVLILSLSGGPESQIHYCVSSKNPCCVVSVPFCFLFCHIVKDVLLVASYYWNLCRWQVHEFPSFHLFSYYHWKIEGRSFLLLRSSLVPIVVDMKKLFLSWACIW